MRPTSFSELQLTESIQRAVEAEKYEQPTPIQAEAIPPLLEGRDLLGCAQTGTGKTAAFSLPMLNQIDTRRKPATPGAPRALILSPTRELAAQIADSCRTYGRFVRYRQTVIYGGVNQTPQVRDLRRGVHLVIATPGRLLDLMDQGHLHLRNLEMFVLDEADRMLDMGFLPDLKRIIADLPEKRQSMFFSATLSPQIAGLAAGLLRDPVRVDISPKSMTVEEIDQRVLFVQQSDKQALLQQVLHKAESGRTLVFTRTRRGADRVAKKLSTSGFRADAIHGDKSQNFRTRALTNFRNGRLQVLVATDVAARGIDVDNITHVINYDMPYEPESYVHRIGRTGRAGADGIALSFCDASERSNLRAIEKLIRMSISIEENHPFHSEKAAAVLARPEKKRRSRPGRHRPSNGGGKSGGYKGKNKRRPARA